jgi:hypothetical protein
MAVRVTQTGVEALVQPDAANLRVTQTGVEVLVSPSSAALRVTQTAIEVLIADNASRHQFTAFARLKGASNKGGNKNTGAPLVIAKPDGTFQGDTLVAVISDNLGTGTTLTPPAGWTLAQARQTSGTSLGQAVYTYPVPANAPATFTWTFTGSPNAVGVINVLANVTGVEAIGTQTNSSSVNIVAPTINTLSANALLLFAGSVAASTTITPPTGMIENPNSDQSTTGVTTELSFQTPFNPVGATGSRTGVAAITGVNIGTLLAFSPAAIETYELTADAVIMPTFTADAILSPAPLVSTFTGVLGRFDATPGHIVLGNADDAITSYVVTADAVLLRTESNSITANSVLAAVGTGVINANSVLLAVTAQSITANSLLRRIESGTFSADSRLLSVVAGSFSASSVLFATTQGQITASAVLRAVGEDDFTADALLMLRVQGGISADSALKATSEGLFTANAVLLQTVSGSFTANAILLQVIPGDLTADSLILRIISGSIVSDAVILDTIEGTFTADARLWPMAESGRPPGVRPGPPEFIVIGDVPAHLRSDLPNVRLQPGGTVQVGQGRIVKRVKEI